MLGRGSGAEHLVPAMGGKLPFHSTVETAHNHHSLCGIMPRFFFHLYDDTVVLDEEGKELPSLEAARREAARNARHMACAEVLDRHLGLNHRIEVTDINDAPVTTVLFKDVVKLHP